MFTRSENGKRNKMNPEIIFNKVKEYMNKIDNSLVYYPLKEFRIKHIRTKTIETVKCCIILDYIGMPITSGIVAYILNIKHDYINNRLHILGDKRILFLKGYGDYNMLVYELHPSFESLLKIGLLEEIIEWRENNRDYYDI